MTAWAPVFLPGRGCCKGSWSAEAIPFLRRCGYGGPIIVVSGQVDRLRRAMLVKAGAVDVIHKDDLDSVRIAEALTRASEAPPVEPPVE